MINKDVILQFWNDLALKYKIGIVSLLGILILWYLLTPKLDKVKKARSELNRIRNEVNKKRIELTNIKKEVKKIPALEKELKTIKETLEEFKTKLITGDEKTKLVNILTFKEQEMEYSSFEMKEIEKKEEELYKQYPIKITLFSNYMLLSEYLDYIESIDFVIKIKKIMVNKVKDSYNRIRTNLELVAYVAK